MGKYLTKNHVHYINLFLGAVLIGVAIAFSVLYIVKEFG